MVKFPFGWRPNKVGAPTTTAVITAKEPTVSLFSDIKALFAKIEKKEPAVATVAEQTLNSVSIVIESVLDVSGQEAEATAIAEAVAIAESSLKAVTAVVTAAGPTATVSSALSAVVANLEGLLTAGQIKDPATLAKVTALVNLAVVEIKNVLASF